MPRYFFDLLGEREAVEDSEGVERSDLAHAIDTAIGSARDVIAGDVRSGSVDLGRRIEIFDEDRAVVASVSFTEAVSFFSGDAPRSGS